MKPRSIQTAAWGVVLFLLGIAVLWPLWKSYLLIPNAEWPTWDPGSHFVDGYRLFLQIVQLDVISFVYQFFHFSFWLPTHPILVFLTQIFSPHSMDAAVFLNFILIAVGASGAVLFIRDQLKLDWLQTSVFSAFALWALSVFSHSTAFTADMTRVMLEPLCVVLTVAVSLSAWMFFYKNRESSFFKWPSFFLFLLLMTKIHYGLYLLPGIFVCAIQEKGTSKILALYGKFYSKPALLAWVGVWLAFFFVFLFRLLNGPWEGELFGAPISFNRFHHILWALFFIPLLHWTFFWFRKKFEIGKISETFHYFHLYCLFPFLWYYFFPVTHKVKAFIENAAYVPGKGISLAEKYGHFIQIVFTEYWSGIPAAVLGAGVLGFLVLMALKNVQKRKFKPVWGEWQILVSIVVFLLLMGRVALFREARFAASLVGLVLSMALIFFVQWLDHWDRGWKKYSLAVVGAMFLISSVFFTEKGLSLSHARVPEIQRTYLPENELNWMEARGEIDFTEPTILWGLGVHHLVPKIHSDFLYQVPAMARHWYKPTYFINDLGYRGMRDPKGFIQHHWNSLEVKQLVFYLPGLDEEMFRWVKTLKGKGIEKTEVNPFWLIVRRF